MKKLLGLERPEEARRFDAPFQNITIFNPSVDSGTARYVIFLIPGCTRSPLRTAIVQEGLDPNTNRDPTPTQVSSLGT
jgi:hypothetical protein